MVKKLHKRALFIFRRDIRLEDNTGLCQAIDQAEEIMPCFIFDSRQVTQDNEYRTLNGIQFMITSLQELDQELHRKNGRLFMFYGLTHEVVRELIKSATIDAIFVNEDYTPFSVHRDKQLQELCSVSGIAFSCYRDVLLSDPALVSSSGKPYRVFTPFYRQALRAQVPKPRKASRGTYVKTDIHTRFNISFQQLLAFDWGRYHNASLFKKGGRKEGLSLLARLKECKNYSETHDFPAFATTGLSAHNKFGTLSIREVYHAIVKTLGHGSLLRQLYWRDFFTYVGYHFPHVFGHAFNPALDRIGWHADLEMFERWCTGSTGFPVIDAGMRQLNETGFMHNRVRLLVGSFLVKDLHIDWRWGERYFARLLVDYDPAVNNGNWQWVASTGCDKQPFFRVFNPWLQQKKFDPQCSYIKRWVPELKDVPSSIIHTWYKQGDDHATGYPLPMLDHAPEAAYAKRVFRDVYYTKASPKD